MTGVTSGLAIWHWPFWGWFFVNICVPMVLPYLGIMFIRATGIEHGAGIAGKLNFAATVRDGQIGWVGLTWAAATIYEGYNGLTKLSEDSFSSVWIGLIIVAEVVIIVAGIAVSAGGAVTSNGTRRRTHYHAATSISITVASGFLFCLIHTHFG